jgi:hypothetical protein
MYVTILSFANMAMGVTCSPFRHIGTVQVITWASMNCEQVVTYHIYCLGAPN